MSNWEMSWTGLLKKDFPEPFSRGLYFPVELKWDNCLLYSRELWVTFCLKQNLSTKESQWKIFQEQKSPLSANVHRTCSSLFSYLLPQSCSLCFHSSYYTVSGLIFFSKFHTKIGSIQQRLNKRPNLFKKSWKRILDETSYHVVSNSCLPTSYA